MEILGTLSSFAISIAANIATDLFNHNSPEVQRQITAAYKAAEKDFFPDLELRDSITARRQLRIIEGEIAKIYDDPEQKEGLDNETQKFLAFFEKRLAEKSAAYNYLKSITDKGHYRKQISELSHIGKEVEAIRVGLEEDRIRPFIRNNRFKLLKFQEEFCINDKVKNVMELLKEGEKVVRLVALSGMGKSRIVYETFKDEKLPLYYCENFDTEIAMNAAEAIIGHEEDCILILDNCPLKYFRQVKNEIEKFGKDIKLISIYNDPTEGLVRGASLIKIEKGELKEIVETYLEKKLGDKENEYFHRLFVFADDIPYMAILLADALLEKGLPLGQLEDNELLDKLLGLDENNPLDKETKLILEAYALFHPLGFEGVHKAQLEFVATNSDITPMDTQDSTARLARFQEVFHRYYQKGLIEQLSDWVNVRPLPLAIWLVSQWFEHCCSNTLPNIIKAIEGLQKSHAQALTEAFAKRIRYMADNDQAQHTLESLLKMGAPFHNAEVVNTTLGSHLFRSFAEVNPLITTEALYDLFAQENIEYLQTIKEEIRRNLVWTLEKLCFNRSSFKKAIKILARLAIAENESWTNNATGIFAQLFHIFLPGTEANLDDRFDIIEFCYGQGELYRQLTLTAINRAFDNNGFHRTGGAEKRGLQEMRDYQPGFEEIKGYWRKCANLLLEWTKQDGTILQDACKIVEGHARSLYRSGCGDLFLEMLSHYAGFKNYNWLEMLDILHKIKEYDLGFSSEENGNLIKDWIGKLTNNDFYFRFNEIGKLGHRMGKKGWNEIVQEQNKLYSDLAEEYVAKEWNNKVLLEKFYGNEFYFANAFIQRICELEHELPEKIDFFIDNSLNILVDGKLPTGYPMFINYCRFIKQPGRIQKLVQVLESKRQYALLFGVTAVIDSGLKQLGNLCQLIKNGEAKIEDFKFYINYIELDSLERRVELYTSIASLGNQGIILLIPFLNLLVYDKESLQNGELLQLIRDCVLSLPLDGTVKYDRYDVVSMAERVLEIGNENEFAVQFNRKILDTLNSLDHYHGLFDTVYSILIGKYGEDIWDDLSKALLSEGEDYMVYYNLKDLLGSGFGFGEGPLFLYDEGKLWAWCESKPEIAPVRLADMAPVFCYNKKEDGTMKSEGFHAVVLRLLDDYGSNDHVLEALYANMNSFSWTGSVIPLFQQKKNAFEQIRSHKNPKVVKWAEENIRYIEREIEYEKKQEDYRRLKYGE